MNLAGDGDDMSRNFDVLARAGREAEIFEPLPPITVKAADHEPTRRPVHIEPAVHEEEMKMIQRLFILGEAQAPRMVVFCGIDREGGTVGICARAGENLAEQTGLPVCLVEGNLSAPSLHTYFNVHSAPGVADAVLTTKPVRKFVRQLNRSNLYVMPAGSVAADGKTPWKTDRWRSCLAELRREYSFVLIAGPPAVQQVEASLLGQMADGVVLVLESNLTRRETARTLKQNLCAGGARILGAVLNNRTFPIPRSIYSKL